MTAKDWLTKAKDKKFAIGAFNVANLETLKAIVQAAISQRSPVIIEASHSEVEYIGQKNFVSLVNNAREETGLPIFSNLDHAPTIEDVTRAVENGFDMVHYNGSHLELDENIKNSITAVNLAHTKNITVEVEIDPIPGHSSINQVSAQEELKQTHFTDPEVASQFIHKTQADILAASFGSIHGLYQTRKHLDLDQLQKIKAQVSCFLSLHGGSDMPNDQVTQAINIGISKINVNSELRLAFRQTLTNSLSGSNDLASYKFMTPVIAAVQQIVENKMILFGSAHQV